MKRVLTALALIPIVVYVVLWANFWAFFGVLVACRVICLAGLSAMGFI